MATSTKKPSKRPPTAQAIAAKRAEEVADVLHSFAASLISLDASTPSTKRSPTQRNWWRVQAGRFKDDPTFPDFVAKVQAARKREG